MNTWVKVACLVLAGLLGFGAGYFTKSGTVAIQTVKVQDVKLQHDKDEAVAQAAANKAAADDASAKLATEQSKTAQLNTTLDSTEATLSDLQEQIRHAKFDAPSPVPVAGKCPGNPLAGDDFARLYTEAASGHASPATGSGTASGGVPPLVH